MDLRQLTTFLQVAELGSLSRAADRLRIAQPALSRQIRLLEAELQVSLFIRHGRGMTLTEPGERLRARAASILRQVEEARTEMLHEAGVVRGHVAFGLPPTVGGVLATRLVERFRARYPEVTLRIVQGFSGYLLEWLHRGEVDIAVLYNCPASASVRLSPLLEENLCLVTPGGDAPSPGRTVTFAETAARRLVLPGAQQGLRQLVEAEARVRGVSLQVVVEADDFQLLKDLVARRVGATILPLVAVRAGVAAGRLRAAPIVDPPLRRRLMVAESLAHPPSTATERFGVLLRAEVAEMVRCGAWEGMLLASNSGLR